MTAERVGVGVGVVVGRASPLNGREGGNHEHHL